MCCHAYGCIACVAWHGLHCILFYKIINNLAQVPHEHILTKAYEGTSKKNNHKFRHIAVNTSQYIGSRFSPKLSVREISCHSTWIPRVGDSREFSD